MNERGGAVLVLLVLLLSGAALGTLMWQAPQQSAVVLGDLERLSTARSGLIEYAVTYPQNYAANSAGPGRFPCPDSNGNGSPGPRCPTVAAGLLPTGFVSSTGVMHDLLQDHAVASEPIWWVVAGPFRNRPAPSGSPSHAMVLNSGTPNTLRLGDDVDVVGVLIAPGPPLSGQMRSGELNIADYLEGENADGDAVFGRAEGNDIVVAIRRHDVMPLVERQVLAAFGDVLKRYHEVNGRYPWLGRAATVDLNGNTLCRRCQMSGYLATPRYRAGAAVPLLQICMPEASMHVDQAPVDLPPWLARNYWHWRVWLHLDDPDCGAYPSLDGERVGAVLAAAGEPLEPAPSGVMQSNLGLQPSDLLDHTLNSEASGRYHRVPGGNDIWWSLALETR